MNRIAVVVLCFVTLVRGSAQNLPDSSSAPDHPTNWTPYVLGGAAVTIFALFPNDQRIYEDIHGWKTRSPFLQNVSPKVSDLGSIGVPVIFTGLAGYGYLSGHNKELRVGILGLESFIASGIATQVLKRLFSRERPFIATRPGGFWYGPTVYFKSPKNPNLQSFDSFPSGHVTSAFSAAATLSDEYDTPWVTWTSYSLATAVAFSRIMESRHWASDCVAGALVGFYSARLVRHLNDEYPSINILPRADAGGYGLILCVRM